MRTREVKKGGKRRGTLERKKGLAKYTFVEGGKGTLQVEGQTSRDIGSKVSNHRKNVAKEEKEKGKEIEDKENGPANERRLLKGTK